jgi:phospholipid/cholesterol/gamma-HCH transport system substrate-binding protein
MATIKTKFTVGLFVIFGLAMVIIAVIWLGMAHYFEEGQYYVAYFDESVQGLDKDSPVKYRGVSIGRVHNIGVAPDANLIQVLLKIETSIQLDKSIVAQLKSVGITGIMFVELERIDAGKPVSTQKINFPTKYPVINTRPSDFKQFFEAVNEALIGFKDLDIKGISDSLKMTLGKIDQAIEAAQVHQLSVEINTALKQIQSITDTEKWSGSMDALDKALAAVNSLANHSQKTVSNLDTAVGHLDHAIKTKDESIGMLIDDMKSSVQEIESLAQNSTLFVTRSNKEMVRFMSQLSMALQHYEKAGKHLNRFLENVADRPSQLLFSAPPERAESEIEKRDKP